MENNVYFINEKQIVVELTNVLAFFWHLKNVYSHSF